MTLTGVELRVRSLSISRVCDYPRCLKCSSSREKDQTVNPKEEKEKPFSQQCFRGQLWLPKASSFVDTPSLVLSTSVDCSTRVWWQLGRCLNIFIHSVSSLQAQLNMLLFYFLQKQQWILINYENQLAVFMSACGNATYTLFPLLRWWALQISFFNHSSHFPWWPCLGSCTQEVKQAKYISCWYPLWMQLWLRALWKRHSSSCLLFGDFGGKVKQNIYW